MLMVEDFDIMLGGLAIIITSILSQNIICSLLLKMACWRHSILEDPPNPMKLHLC